MSQLQVTGEAKIRDIQGPVVANSGVITALDGAASQYVRGDGTLADFPTSTGGGSSVSYYLNSSVSQGTIGGVAYRELSKDPIIGAGTDITISANGYVANYITDANDPDVTIVPGGNFNCEFYFSVNNNTGNPTTYAELYKYDGTTFTLLGSSVAVPESLNQGTTIAPYYFAIPVATAALALTDRLAIRIYVSVDGRTVTLHTENSHLCQVVTTFSKGMVSLNNLTDQSQYLTTGTSGTNFNIVSSGDTHTFNLPVASATNTGKLSNTDWSTFNNKLSTTTAAATYVPYTGATSNVDLGTYAILANAFAAQGNGISGGVISLKQNGQVFAATGSAYIGSESAGKLNIYFGDSGLQAAILDNSLLTVDRTYNLPDASGTLALTSNLSSYVPYTGATANVDLGSRTLTSSNNISASSFVGQLAIILGTSSYGGTVGLYPNATYTLTDGYLNMNASSSTKLNLAFGQGSGVYKYAIFDVSGLTNATNRTYALPDASGTIALLSGTQTFTGATTFSSDITVNGVRVGKGAGSISTNTVVGSSALSANTTGYGNTSIGLNNLIANTTGFFNVAIGASSLISNTTGTYNAALGTSSLYNNTTGSNNTAVGQQAGESNTTGSNNTYIGWGSGYGIQTGSNNTIIGAYTGTAAMSNNIVLADGQGNIRYQWNGTNNVFTGAATFSSSVTASSFISSSTGNANVFNSASATTGWVQIAMNNTSGSAILAIESSVAGTTTNGSLAYATILRNYTATDLQFATNNIVRTTITSAGNVGIGTSSTGFNAAGLPLVAGSGSGNTGLTIFSGASSFGSIHFADAETTGSASFAGYINYGHTDNSMQFGTSATERMRITSGGNVGIGTSTAPYLLTLALPSGVNGEIIRMSRSAGAYAWSLGIDSATSHFNFYNNSSTSVANINLSTGAYTATSDERLKENILDSDNAIEKLLQIKVRKYDWKDTDIKEDYGFVAQELYDVLPQYVSKGDEDRNWGVAKAELVPILVKAIQELESRIKQLENK